jgi:hypothetical protein
MRFAALGAVGASVLLQLAPASAGASAAPPPVSLAASPARVALVGGSGQAAIRVTNSGTKPVEVVVTRAGFSLDLRGRPRIVPRSRAAAASWLAVRPRTLSLRPRSTGSLTVSSLVPPGSRAGDHGALIVLTTRPIQGARVAVRMRLGVLVLVRAPGTVSRRLELRRLRVRRLRTSRILELYVANRGNVAEVLQRGRVTITLRRGRLVLTRLRPPPRELLPHSAGLVVARYVGRARGPVTAEVEVANGSGQATRRAFRIRL